MKRLAWMSAGILAFAGMATPCPAQGILSRICPIPTRQGPCPAPSTMPGTPDSLPPTTPDTPAPTPDFSGAGEFKGSIGRTSSIVAGTGLGGVVTGDPTNTGCFSPLVLPGMFTAGLSQSAVPVDRIFFDYGYFNGVAVYGVGSSAPRLVRTTVQIPDGFTKIFDNSTESFILVPKFKTAVQTSVAQSSNPVPGFNLNTFDIGIEKTFFDGIASVYLSVPFLYATENISGQQINGLGDINAGFKVILYQNLPTGNTFTGGLTVSFPSAHASVSTSAVQSNNGTGDTLVPSSPVQVNPTYFQPWLAGLVVFDRLFIHDYFGVMVPTDQNVATFLNNDFSIGYSLIRSKDNLWMTSLTPNLGVKAFIPVNRRGTIPDGQGVTTFVPFNSNGSLPAAPTPSQFLFSDQIFLSGGFSVGLGERWLASANVVVPVAGPRAFNVGATFGLNYFY
jgi:hypothetical protein